MQAIVALLLSGCLLRFVAVLSKPALCRYIFVCPQGPFVGNGLPCLPALLLLRAPIAKMQPSHPRLGRLCKKHRKHSRSNTAEGDCATFPNSFAIGSALFGIRHLLSEGYYLPINS